MDIPKGFLADVCEHPDDDTPRLVLADWLDDHGDEEGRARADFIPRPGRAGALKRPEEGPQIR